MSYRAQVDWGWQGAREAAARGDVVVIVDVLRFSTAVACATARGVVVYPRAADEDAEAFASSIGARFLRTREGLSPATYDSLAPGTCVVVRSPNGATCARLARAAPLVVAGAIVNASAVAACINALDRDVTIVACGERWADSSEDGALRFAIEDWLGAGAILSKLDASLSPEARVCAAGFEAVKHDLREILLACPSGIELIDRGQKADVEFAAQLDHLIVVPVLRQDRFESL